MWNTLVSRLFGTRTSRGNKTHKPAALRLENLEGRELMAAQITANLTAGILRVEGTEGADRIVITQQASQIRVAGVRQAFRADAVRTVQVFGLGGNDTIVLSQPGQVVSRNAILEGGDGNDLILGGSGHDLIRGGKGNDRLYGGLGMDSLFGGEGRDFLFGGAGADRFLGQSGDTVRDLNREDALVQFANGTKAWTESEINAIDRGMALLVARTRNTSLLELADGKPITMRREAILQDSESIAGDNDSQGTIRFADRLFQRTPGEIASSVIHELAHNFDTPTENQFITAFRKLSGWKVESGAWVASPSATFALAYGKTSPVEDFATTVEAAFGGVSDQNIQAKIALVNRWLDAVRAGRVLGQSSVVVDLGNLEAPNHDEVYSTRRSIASVITVRNNTSATQTYYIYWPGTNGWERVSLQPGYWTSHAYSGMNVKPVLSMDTSAAAGYQEGQYSLYSKPFVISPDEGWAIRNGDGMVYDMQSSSSRYSLTGNYALDTSKFSSERSKVSALGFPKLGQNFEVLGGQTDTGAVRSEVGYYNCIAWTIGQVNKWEWPGTTVSSFDNFYWRNGGYQRIQGLDYRYVPGYQKVVLYAYIQNGQYVATHGAYQLTDGTWTSKLGNAPLIRHATPDAVSGGAFDPKGYGIPIAVYMRRV